MIHFSTDLGIYFHIFCDSQKMRKWKLSIPRSVNTNVVVCKTTYQVMKGFHCDIGILSYFLNLTDSTSTTLLLPGQYVREVPIKYRSFPRLGVTY